jgi:hypothetical protein
MGQAQYSARAQEGQAPLSIPPPGGATIAADQATAAMRTHLAAMQPMAERRRARMQVDHFIAVATPPADALAILEDDADVVEAEIVKD